ncbi:MAG: Hsp33 family molecular chaperone HslO [Treponema sp.]|nr:Hsp33 family molecular chaperone HslO [Treponema sp.]
MIKKELTDRELKEHLDSLHKDEMVVFVMADGRVRGALFHGSRFVNTMRLQHNLGILETMVLGQASLCGALLLPTMKGKEHVTWRYEVDGPAEGFSVEADSTGWIRSYLFNDHIPVSKPLDSWDLSPFLGEGTLTMSTLREFDKEPQMSSVSVSEKNIAKDLAWYFQQSEQIQTAFSTSIQMDLYGRVIGAGGMFLQVLPQTGGTKADGANTASGADQEEDSVLIEKVENAFKACPSLGKWFAEKGDIEDIVYGLFREFNPTVAVTRNVVYDCPCTEEHFKNYLNSLPKEELEDMKKNGPNPVEIVCRNCGSVYHIKL